MASTIYTPQNMSTAEVKKMQQALVDHGYSVGSSGVDGIWGKDTSAALKAFKAATGGSNTYGNTVGNETFNKLYGTGSSGTSGTGSSNKGGATGGTSSVPSAVGSGVAVLPGYGSVSAELAYPGIFNDFENLQNNFNTQLGNLNSAVDGYVTQLQSGAGNANAALEEARSNALAGIKSTYDDSARNYYRLYRTQEKELPEQLSSIGATGGATESAALRLMNNYSDNLYKNETARNQDINGLNEDYYNAVAKNSAQLAQQIADAYLQKAQQQNALQNTFYSQQQNLLDYAKQYAADQASAQSAAALVAQNNNARQQQYDLERQGYSTKGWTDGNGVYQYSITGNPTTTKKKVGNTGSGSSGSGSGTGSGSDTNSASYNYYYKMASAHLANGRNADGRIGGEQAVLNYIDKIPESSLSETQKTKLAKELGIGKK